MSRLSDALTKYGCIPLDELEQYSKEQGCNLYRVIAILNDLGIPLICARQTTTTGEEKAVGTSMPLAEYREFEAFKLEREVENRFVLPANKVVRFLEATRTTLFEWVTILRGYLVG